MKPKIHKILHFVIPALCIIAVTGAILCIHFSASRVSAKETINYQDTRPFSESRTDASKSSKSTETKEASKGTKAAVIQDKNDRSNFAAAEKSLNAQAVNTGLTQNNTKGRIAYLTFDDGPSKLTPELIETLNICKVHATFFVIGLHAQQYPDTLRQIVASNDVIGVHSWTHKYSYIYRNTQNFLDDFNELKDYIQQETGVAPNVCRFPGGANNTVCFHYNKNHIMKQAVSLVKDMGFQYFDWNVSSGEASSVPPSKNVIINRVVSQCKNKNTAVILFHDTSNQAYIDAIPEIIAQLRSMGFSFGTLSPDSPAVQFKPT